MSKITNYEDYEKITLDAVEKYNSENYNDALKDFLAMAKYHPNNLKVHELLCYTYSKLKESEKAQKEYSIYLKLAKEQGKSVLKLKSFDELIKDAGDINEIQEDYEQSLNAQAEDFDLSDASAVAMKYTHLLMAQERYKEAASAMEAFKNKVLSLRKVKVG